MFLVRSLDGVTRPYQVGEIRRRRKAEPVTAIPALASVVNSPESEPSTPFQANHFVQRYQENGPKQETRRELTKAHEIMSTPVMSVQRSATMTEVQNIFSEHRFRHLPVVSETGQLVGLISDRDVLRFQLELLEIRTKRTGLTPVSEVMTSDILTATSDTPIRLVAQTLFEERIGSMPIVDDSNQIQGIITRSDILRALINFGPMHLWA
jgi:CBS domain-containing protein